MLMPVIRASVLGVLSLSCASVLAQTEAAPTTTPPETAAPAEPTAGSPAAVTPTDAVAPSEPVAPPQIAADGKESLANAAGQKERDARKGVAVAGRVSTLGLGVELITSVHKRVNLRLQGNFFDINKSVDEDDINYDGKLKLQTLGLLADFHPFAGGFRMTAGGYQNGNKVGLNAKCKTECEVGDLTISNDPNAGDDGRLFGRIKFQSLAPYLGLGFGNAMRGSPLHFGIDIGVLLQGSPKINLGAAGTALIRETDDPNSQPMRVNLAENADVQNALRAEARNAEDDAKEFKYYPVINFTVGYRFRF